jgi:hypothetical protein
MTARRVLLANLRNGQAFTFIAGGAVYVRCKGGYRPGCGGVLVGINPEQLVYRYNPAL